MKSSHITISVAAALALLLGGAYAMVVRPAEQRRIALQLEIDQKQATLARFDQTTASLRAVSAKVQELRPVVVVFESRFMAGHEMDKIVAEISRLAEANSVIAKTIKIPAERQTDTYRQQDVDLTLTGNFGGFYQFLLQVEAMPRIARIRKISLTKAADSQVQAELTLSFYFQPTHFSGERQ